MHKQIRYLISVNAFFVFAINMFAPFYAIFVQNIGAEVFHIGGIWAFFVFSSGIAIYLVSRHEDHLRYATYFLIVGFLMRMIGWAGYIFADSVLQLYLIQIPLALGEAFGTPSYNSLFSKYLDKGRFATEWGFSTSVSYILMGVAASAGSLIVAFHGFRYLFIFMIILSLASTLMAVRFRTALGNR